MWVIFENDFGERCEEPLYAEFTDDMGVQWVVTREWRNGHPLVLRRESVTIIRGKGI